MVTASRRNTFDVDCNHCNQALPKGSGFSATDLQISPNYVYPTGIHTDSSNNSADSQWAQQIENWRPEAMRRRKDFYLVAVIFLGSTRNWVLSSYILLGPRNSISVPTILDFWNSLPTYNVISTQLPELVFLHFCDSHFFNIFFFFFFFLVVVWCVRVCVCVCACVFPYVYVCMCACECMCVRKKEKITKFVKS
jgi:hypothetical protein